MRDTLCALVFNGVRAGETFGTEIGTLKSSKNGISGQVFHVNSTFVQIRRFTINEGLNVKFAVSSATQVGLVKNLYELKSNKDGVDFLEPVDLLLSDAFDDKTLIAELPKKKKEESWQFFGVINEKEWKYLAATSFDNKVVPSKFCCLAPLNGWAFGLKSGPVDVLDSKTLRVADFSFDGHKAPDAWFFVGKDSIDKKNARRCAILKRDTKML
uniref:DM13 domain-containing protein n=1 Tax=Romanomermis culicivorax TaxID=13658 RepID=A0A915JVY5_ROMCU